MLPHAGGDANSDVKSLYQRRRIEQEHLRDHQRPGAPTGTLTIKTPQTVDGNAVADRTHTLAASRTSVLFGPFPAAIYGDTLEVSATNQGTLKIQAVQF